MNQVPTQVPHNRDNSWTTGFFCRSDTPKQNNKTIA